MQILNQIEFEIKKSKFIGFAVKLECNEDISVALADIGINHKKATHICYAYISDFNSVIEKCSDAKEPNGTAGRPMLNVIKKKNLTNILVVAVRYFGGVKLGAGGLMRAYTKAASMALDFNQKRSYS